MHPPTMKVKRGDQIVIINVDDFDPETDTRLDEKPKPVRKVKR